MLLTPKGSTSGHQSSPRSFASRAVWMDWCDNTTGATKYCSYPSHMEDWSFGGNRSSDVFLHLWQQHIAGISHHPLTSRFTSTLLSLSFSLFSIHQNVDGHSQTFRPVGPAGPAAPSWWCDLAVGTSQPAAAANSNETVVGAFPGTPDIGSLEPHPMPSMRCPDALVLT